MSTQDYMKKWRAEHAEDLRMKAAARYQANKEERRRKAREHYHAIPKEVRIAKQKAKKRPYNAKRKAYNAAYFQAHKAEHNAYKVAWRERNPEATKSSGRKSMLKQRVIRKAKVMAHYGGKCTCCGESGIDFLTIDHTHGGGNVHRASIGKSAGDQFYKWLIKQGFPDGYRCLCANCNLSASFHNGVCAHQLVDQVKPGREERSEAIHTSV